MQRRASGIIVLATVITLAACDSAGTVPPSGSPGSPSPEELFLVSGVRLDLQGHCDPQRDELPQGAVAAVACAPDDDVVGHVALSVFDTQQALLAAYLAELDRHGVAPRTNGGFCTAGEVSEGAYVPGDDGPVLSPERGACYGDPAGAGHYLAMLPPFVLADVTGTSPDAAEAALWTWRGNQDVPGGPTVWRASGPASPEK